MARPSVAHAQQARLVEAMTGEVARVGYGAVRIVDVARRAGVSLSTFYAHHPGKLECFVAAYDAVATDLITAITADANEPDPLLRLAGATGAYLRWFAQRPDAARAYLVEVHAAGAAGLRARTAVIERFVTMSVDLAEGIAAAATLRPYLLLVDAMAHEHLLDRGAADLPALEPVLLELGARMLA